MSDDEPLDLGEPDDLSAIRVPISEAEEIRDEWKARALKAEAKVAQLRRGMSANQNDDIMYGDDEGGRLTAFDPMEVAEQILDRLVQIEWPIRVYAYRRMRVSETQARHIATRALDDVLERLDEEYGDPDGECPCPTPAMIAAAELFVAAVVSEYVPHACEQTGEVIEITREQAEREFGEQEGE